MTQVTWRAPDDVVARARRAAHSAGTSLNEYLTRLVGAATDPELAGNDVERLRERLALAGLLVSPGSPRRQPTPTAVRDARRRAGQGTPLADFVAQGRG